MRVTDVHGHQVEFLANFGSRFTGGEIRHMREAWEDYFVRERQAQLRNGVVWCCLTRALAVSHGTEPFFQCFGGEAIYMPLKEHPTIGLKLQSIGAPVIVEFSVSGKELATFQQLSHVVLSRYHQTIRADAHSCEAEARVFRAIRPEEILAVTPLVDFEVAVGLSRQEG
ncbi:MAG: hypothetical protein J0L58_02655 [Burkholderiales bacterium]|nr:hypothetical protein [Burkholderiales bacterium]